MKTIIKSIITALALTAPISTGAQGVLLDAGTGKKAHILTSADTVRMGYNPDFKSIAVAGNSDYTVAGSADWFTCRKESNGNLTLFSSYNSSATTPRTGQVTLTTADGNLTRTLIVEQAANTAAFTVPSDIKHEIQSATASSEQGGEGIEKSYDNNPSTIYHSAWSGTTMPVTLTYTIKEPSHVDYALYTTRPSGSNGNFGEVRVLYTTIDNSLDFKELGVFDLGQRSGTHRIDFGKNGIDNVKRIKFEVLSAASDGSGKNFASCAEMGFYSNNNTFASELAKYFNDALCTQLKPEVDEAAAAGISEPYVRQLVTNMLSSDYSKKYRVGEFEPYRTVESLSRELMTSNYNRYENPTGIYFTKDMPIVLFVEGITEVAPSLIIKSFGPSQYDGDNQPESSYPLKNGVNLIMPTNRGNGYISYYSDNFASLPKVKIHFAMADENGYFDLQRGDTNEDWQNLLANAKSDIIDIRSQRMQVAAPLVSLQRVCPRKGMELAQLYDNVILREWEIMGLAKYGREPKNRQFARCVTSGMYADGVGAAAAFGSFDQWTNPDDLGFWGLGHELGHVNQVRPGFKWDGMGETTNNVYAAWVEHTLGNGYHRLEDENSGIGEYRGWRGGRFQAYLEEGVRKGITWQLQDGPDYHGSTPNNVTVKDEDANGNQGQNVQTTKRNYDHFLKVVPLYQLELFCLNDGAAQAPDAYGKMLEGIRNNANTNLTNGQFQLQFMKTFCDSTQINFIPFFEKAGMLNPVKAYIEDYSPGWLIITEEMVKELKDYIGSKNYAPIPESLNYINAYNWQVFRDKGTIDENTPVNAGCTSEGNAIKVDNEVWKNAVGYETYDADNNLLRISMFGLGDAQKSSRYTKVLWPASEGAAYIMAVGYNGQRVKCYQK